MDYTKFLFKLRYKILDSTEIFNECGPESSGDPDLYIASLNYSNGFYTKLEKSVLENGFLNPILVRAGWCPESKRSKLPPEMQKDPRKILICDANGGSRLWVAQNHKMNIPAIIIDYVNRFPEAELLKCQRDVENKYANKPKLIINRQGLNIQNLPHIHLA